MRLLAATLLCLISLNCYAYEHTYNVQGIDVRGNSVVGTLNSDHGSRFGPISGTVIDQYGHVHGFAGTWGDEDEINGVTDEGVPVSLTPQMWNYPTQE